MKKYSKIVASLIIIFLCIIILCTALGKTNNKKDANTLCIFAPTWIYEKFKLGEAVDHFMEENPGIHVTIEQNNNQDSSYYPLMNKSLLNKYDIVIGGSREHIVLLAASGAIVNFDNGFFDENLRKEDFFPSFLELGNINGNQYMIPLMGEVISLIIREDLFAEAGLVDQEGRPIPPRDWEELYSYAGKLTGQNENGEKIYGLNIDFGNNMLLYNFYACLQSKRGNIFDNNSNFIDYSSDDVKYVMDMWQRLVKNGFTPTYTFEDNDAGRTNFKNGTVAMSLTPHSRWVEISEVLGEDKVGILPLPQAEGNGSLTYIHGITVPIDSPNKELAFQFIKTELLSKDFQQWTMEKYGKIPSLVRNYETDLSPEWNSVFSWVRNATTLPIYKDWLKIDKTLQLELQKCIMGDQTSEQTIEKIKNQLDGIRDKQILLW